MRIVVYLTILFIFISTHSYPQDSTQTEIFTIVEQPAQPEGGYSAFYRYIGASLRYPVDAREAGAEGRVFVQFIVNEQGKLTDVKVIKGVHPSLDAEAKRVIEEATPWQPAVQRGIPVKQRIVIPISFGINTEMGTVGAYQRVDSTPEPSEGYEELGKWIRENISINEPVPINKIGSTVTLSFVIEPDGKASNFTITRSLGEKFDQEAIRLYSKMPPWKPAMVNGEPVSYEVRASVSFSQVSESKHDTATDNFYRATIQFEKNNFKKALELYTKAIEKDPETFVFHYGKALSLLKLSNVIQGCEILNEIKHLDQDAFNTHATYCY